MGFPFLYIQRKLKKYIKSKGINIRKTCIFVSPIALHINHAPAPAIPAKPVPEVNPTRYSEGKAFRKPRFTHSPMLCAIPISKVAINDIGNPQLSLVFTHKAITIKLAAITAHVTDILNKVFTVAKYLKLIISIGILHNTSISWNKGIKFCSLKCAAIVCAPTPINT